MPEYATKDILREKLEVAMANAEGFGMVWKFINAYFNKYWNQSIIYMMFVNEHLHMWGHPGACLKWAKHHDLHGRVSATTSQ